MTINLKYKHHPSLYCYCWSWRLMVVNHLLPHLCYIHKALVAKSPAMKEVFDHLILGEDVLTEDDFDEVKKQLIYVKVLDRLTGEAFVSGMLEEPVYSPSSIVWLQAKVRKLYKVDTRVIEHENPMAQ